MQPLTELPYGLSGKIYRSPMPGSPAYDPLHRVLPAYQAAGVQLVVMLAPLEEVALIRGGDLLGQYHDLGIKVLHTPVQDYGMPELALFQSAVGEALAEARAGRTLAVHCHAGLGRTGMFAACLAKQVFGFDGTEAMAWVRRSIPGAVENAQQVGFVAAFELNSD